MARKKRKKEYGPVITILFFIVIISVLSLLFSLLGITGNLTSIENGSTETTLVTVNNVLTKTGIKYIITNVLNNFKFFEPLVLLIISLITMSIGKASGLFKAVCSHLRKINPKFLTFLVLLFGIVSSFFGIYSYVFLVPLVAIIYKEIDRKPLLGIITMFLGITMGYGTGVMFDNEEIILGTLTQKAAAIDVDPNYTYSLLSNFYISFATTFILAIVGTFIIHENLDRKIPKSNYEEIETINYSKKGMKYSNIAFVVMLVAVLYMIIPGLPGSGMLLGNGSSYIEQLLGTSSPFNKGFSFIILMMVMICGCIYGYMSGNIKDSTDYSVAMSKEFEGLGYLFVLLFFTSQMISILEWTNLGNVIAIKLANLISSLSLVGIPLLIILFIFIIIMTLLLPSSEVKWRIISPIVVPLLMRSNVTPNFAQFIFRMADGIGKSLTPFFAYYIVMIAFLEKYNTKENNKITILGILRTILPTILIFAGLILLIILCWYLVGLPTGPNVYPTL